MVPCTDQRIKEKWEEDMAHPDPLLLYLCNCISTVLGTFPYDNEGATTTKQKTSYCTAGIERLPEPGEQVRWRGDQLNGVHGVANHFCDSPGQQQQHKSWQKYYHEKSRRGKLLISTNEGKM
jgi:hypothetical protein